MWTSPESQECPPSVFCQAKGNCGWEGMKLHPCQQGTEPKRRSWAWVQGCTKVCTGFLGYWGMVKGRLGYGCLSGPLWSSTHKSRCGENRHFNSPQKIRECEKHKPFQFFETRAKLKVITVRWTCVFRKVNDQILHSLMLGEIIGTRGDLYRMTQALRNYLAITHHFSAHDCLRFYLNCFYFSVLYFSSQMNCVIDNFKICGVTLVLQILYDSMCNKKLALLCQGCWHIHKLPFWSLSSAFTHSIANTSTSKACNLIQ